MSSPAPVSLTKSTTSENDSNQEDVYLDCPTQQRVKAPSPPSGAPARLPVLRPPHETQPSLAMTPSSSPLGNLNASRRPDFPQPAFSSSRGSQLPQDMQAKMKAFHLSRQAAPPQTLQMPAVSGDQRSSSQNSWSAGHISREAVTGIHPTGLRSPGGPLVGGSSGVRLPVNRPPAPAFNSAPAVPGLKPKTPSLAAKRGLAKGMKLSDATGVNISAIEDNHNLKHSDVADTSKQMSQPTSAATAFSKYSEYVDTKAGTLNFRDKAIIHSKGVDFSSGTSFNISLDEVDNLDELGKGNYGTVFKVKHRRPQIRRPGQGLLGNKIKSPVGSSSTGTITNSGPLDRSSSQLASANDITGIVMAMKEIRLELDEAKFAAIIMELDILHRCVSPFIIDFYGAFFQEGAVYICMEYMDGGSIDKLYGDGVPESVLQKITLATVMGLKALKDDHNIIHRDVKPTNILINTKGQVKICDFGVSGNLVASIAKTNIGCQSYMAPERISGGGLAQTGADPGGGTYSVQSDIWSLGLSIIECALGQYPYPPETYDNIFSQLSAIVDGEPPDLPADKFSEAARDFVKGALNKKPKLRPTYAMLLRHAWLSALLKPPTITEEDEEDTGSEIATADVALDVVDAEVARWVSNALERKQNGRMGKKSKPALHAAPLDAVPPSQSPETLTVV